MTQWVCTDVAVMRSHGRAAHFSLGEYRPSELISIQNGEKEGVVKPSSNDSEFSLDR